MRSSFDEQNSHPGRVLCTVWVTFPWAGPYSLNKFRSIDKKKTKDHMMLVYKVCLFYRFLKIKINLDWWCVCWGFWMNFGSSLLVQLKLCITFPLDLDDCRFIFKVSFHIQLNQKHYRENNRKNNRFIFPFVSFGFLVWMHHYFLVVKMDSSSLCNLWNCNKMCRSSVAFLTSSFARNLWCRVSVISETLQEILCDFIGAISLECSWVT